MKLDVYPPNSLTGADSAFSIFAFPIRMLSLVLCFFLMRIGRTLLCISVATSMILYHGSIGGIIHREISGITWMSEILLGAILAMMFFSPASVYFQNKRAETGR